MAGRLSRRGFLGATAGLLAARPTFSAPQAVASLRREPFPVQLRQDPPHEKLRDRLGLVNGHEQNPSVKSLG